MPNEEEATTSEWGSQMKSQPDWRYMAFAALMGVAGGGGVSIALPPVKYQASFNATDAALLEARVLTEMDKRLEVQRLHDRRKQVPEPVRQRILHLERAVVSVLPHYKPPTDAFVEQYGR